MDRDKTNARAARLNKLFSTILNNGNALTPHTGPLFLEALYSQPDPVESMGKLSSSAGGLTPLKTAIRYDLSPKFLNTHASALIQYFQSPKLKSINNGDFLNDILLGIVDPPIFWVEFRKAFLKGELSEDSSFSFAWLLLQLCSLPAAQGATYRGETDMSVIINALTSSPVNKIQQIGLKIKEVLLTSMPCNDPTDTMDHAPGGRHDNDFADFRQISILPTGNELESTETPFLRPSSVLEDPRNEGSRVAIHLDNQFRLLREDMIHELREELQVAVGTKKGRHRGTKINGLTLTDVLLGDDNDKKRAKWCLIFKCGEDFPEMKKMKEFKTRKDYLTNKRQFFKHQSLACLLAGREILAFPTIHRDEDRLAKSPPEIVLQFEDSESTQEALRRLKMGDDIMLIQVDTAIFSYEPILKGLQQASTLPLSSEILLWKEGDVPGELDTSAQCTTILRQLHNNPQANLKSILNTVNDIKLDASQASSLISGLSQKVSLIQGPPGTGKSFIGALIAKSIHDFTERTILVVCYTNHALDDILTGLLDVGIPAESMLRLGGKSTNRTEPLTLRNQTRGQYKRSQTEWKIIDELKVQLRMLRQGVDASFRQYLSSNPSLSSIMDYLEIEAPEYFSAFQMPDSEEGMSLVGSGGKDAQADYLLGRWSRGQDAGSLKGAIAFTHNLEPWKLKKDDRIALIKVWKEALMRETIQDFCDNAQEFNRCCERLKRAFTSEDANILRSKRIVGCTTTAAAIYREEIQTFNPDVLLVEEAGEILESHVLTALGPQASQIVLIGDHKQLRPKVNHYMLTVEKGDGYDLNRSLFERLILKDYPHQSLSQQHRMRPEISSLIRHLTYPELVDAPKTQNRPNILGLQDNIVFIHHENPEDVDKRVADRNDNASTSSKQNSFEVHMILKIVKYLAQQGYGTDQLVILTPYLGQLHKLRDILKNIADPILNDLDSHELVRAGLIDPATAKLTKKPIRLATIDNYQGEESDIVLVSLTRSNDERDIGFMSSPERLNVLLSRARNGLIMLGNAETFKNARKGKELWRQLFDLLNHGKHVYHGLPIQCERHPDAKALVTQAAEFDTYSPDGGCILPCGTLLSCGVHPCPSKCHQLSDHSKLICKEMMTSKCPNDHPQTWPCGKGPPVICHKCERALKLAKRQQQTDLLAQERRDAEQKAHLERMDALNAQIAQAKAKQEDTRLANERANAVKQKEEDLASVLANQTHGSPSVTSQNVHIFSLLDGRDAPTPITQAPTSSLNAQSTATPPYNNTPSTEQSPPPPKSSPMLDKRMGAVPSVFSTSKAASNQSSHQNKPAAKPFKDKVESPASQEWARQKRVEGAQNDAIDSLMGMTGLESVKDQVLAIKAKIDTSVRQNSSLKKERFNAVFLGNPGTGKTTVARHYAKFLSSVKVTPGNEFIETTGANLAHDGVEGAKTLVEKVIKAGGGTVFIDEAYQLTNGNNHGGPAVLDFLLAEMENNVGTVVFILAGYNKEMEKFFEHNPGLKSRVPYEFKFADYENEELMSILEDMIVKDYQNRMEVEQGIRGLYGRVAVRRLGRRRGKPGFGNARELQTLFSRIKERQAIRLTRERRDGKYPKDFYMTKEDIIGPNPADAIKENKAWTTLQDMIGLQSVKKSVKDLFSLIEENYERELTESEPLEMSLNRVFLGSPGTGKTTVAKLYGQILADIGLLSNGEVVTKNPSDFVGAVLGASEQNTKAILANSIGKVLIIDEAYMLYGGGNNDGQQGGGSSSNQFKTSVVDTIVAEVQNVPGEDRCVLLLGYKDQMMEMFQNVNPGLSRRFKIEDAFTFEDFNEAELQRILELKLKQQDLGATDEAKKIALQRLSQMKKRPNFGNGGEVENLITQAKARAVARRTQIPAPERDSMITFLPDDFDPEWNRAATASANLVKLFSDVIGCEDIIRRLENYQKIVQACRDTDINPEDLIPTNFVFSGPPGTGKTTVARKLGQAFYDMGMLGTRDFIECSATDLVGQFVGQTGPKTKKLFEKALGKVLFIDEAYRLSGGHFAQEAIDELVGLLTHPTFKSKLIVILAGYEKDMNQLMSVNTGLSSRFPEQIFFNNMDADSCLKVIDGELQKMKVTIDNKDSITSEMREMIRDLSELPDWGNARDMVTASKEMVQRALLNQTRVLSGKDVLNVLQKILADRQRRSKIPPSTRRMMDLPVQSFTREPQPPPSVATSSQSTPPPANAASAPPSNHNISGNTRGRGRRGATGRGTHQRDQPGRADVQPRREGDIQRDPGVSDAVWRQLQAAKRAAEEIERKAKQEINRLQKEAAAQKRQEEESRKQAADLRRAEDAERDAAKRAELLRQREEAKRKELAARAEKARIEAALRAKREEERRRKAEEERAQKKLREMGVCPVGFQWIRQGSIYRCAGGSHIVSVDSLGL